MKEKIKNLILEGNQTSLRLILSKTIELDDNELEYLVELSKNKGIKMIESILINKIPASIRFYTNEEKEKLIVDVIAELSEDIYAASWYEKIEFELWTWSETENSIPDYINHRVVGLDLKELRDLSLNLNLWALWDIGDTPRSINLNEWKLKVK